MAGTNHLRCGIKWGAVGALVLLAAEVGGAAEPVAWLADQAAAVVQARKAGKFLLVVELSGDFARNSADAREAQIYRRLALGDARVAKELADRFVVVYRHVGESEALQRIFPAKQKPSPVAAEMALTYICLPDERVLHFFPGFVSADELLAEIRWVEATYSKLLQVPEADQPLALRAAHQGAVAKGDRALFATLCKSRWQDQELTEGDSAIDLLSAMRGARTTLERSLIQRLGASWQVADAPGMLAALGSHGLFGVKFGHLVSSEFPLIPLVDLERPAFETCTGRRFWQSSRRRESLAMWWSTTRKSNQPTLLVVADDAFASEENRRTPFVWPLANAETLADLPRFAAQVVTIDELAQLIVDAGLDPITYKSIEQPPRYLLFDATGKRGARLAHNEGTTRLAQALHAVIKSGEMAVAAEAKGE